MDNLIKELAKIEQSAKQVLSKTIEDEKNLHLIIEERRKEIEDRIGEETKQRIKEVHNKYFEESREKVSEISISLQKKFAELEREFAESHEKWENEIFENIIK